MLIEFRLKNYKSFAQEAILSLVPAAKLKGLDYSVLVAHGGRKKYKALCSSVVYGANASGKTNLIGAMETLRSIVLRGDIRDSKDIKTPNAASGFLSLIPNRENNAKPVLFRIKFFVSGSLVEYELDFDLGEFLDEKYRRKILTEKLALNELDIFIRKENTLYIYTENLKKFRKYLLKDFQANVESALKLAESSINREELFLKNGFKTMFSPKITSLLSEWFERKFIVIYHADSIQRTSAADEKILNEIVHQLGLHSTIIKYRTEEDKDKESKLYSAITDDKGNIRKGILSEVYESYGTIRLINLLPLIISVLKNGGVLAADELDASIHPMILMNIINIFHDNTLNVNHAQLIFNTHNPVFLNSNIFRRDEIKFVEAANDSDMSILYSLSDFDVRKNEDYMKNYFVDRYGAIRDADFSPMIREMLNSHDKE